MVCASHNMLTFSAGFARYTLAQQGFCLPPRYASMIFGKRFLATPCHASELAATTMNITAIGDNVKYL